MNLWKKLTQTNTSKMTEEMAHMLMWEEIKRLRKELEKCQCNLQQGKQDD